MKKLYVFDLDGVLIDSKSNMEKSFISLQTGKPFEDYFKHIGKPFKDILTEIGILTDQDELMAEYNKASSANSDMIKFYDGVESHLQSLKAEGKKLAVVTSKHSGRAHAILDELDVEFDAVVCPDNDWRGKPAPDQLLIALAHCNVDPKDAVYVGDMQVDMDCADRAGVDFIYAEYGYGDIECCWNRASSIESV
jgi:HAD superfamily hydrolase (TIGR01662 family)